YRAGHGSGRPGPPGRSLYVELQRGAVVRPAPDPPHRPAPRLESAGDDADVPRQTLYEELRDELVVDRRLLGALDHDDVERFLSRLEVESQLVLERGRERCAFPFELELIPAGQSGPVDDQLPFEPRKQR